MKYLNKSITLLVGPSGSGKSTLEKRLVATGAFGKLTSVTTRPIRGGEIDGLDYTFIDDEAFSHLIATDQLCQYVHFTSGDFYGVTKQEMDRAFEAHDNVVVVVEPTGIEQYTEALDCTGVAIIPILITNAPIILVERMLERFQKDKRAQVNNYARRLLNMLANEIRTFPQHDYAMRLDRFDAENEQYVVEAITEYAEKFRHGMYPDEFNKEENELHAEVA